MNQLVKGKRKDNKTHVSAFTGILPTKPECGEAGGAVSGRHETLTTRRHLGNLTPGNIL